MANQDSETYKVCLCLPLLPMHMKLVSPQVAQLGILVRKISCTSTRDLLNDTIASEKKTMYPVGFKPITFGSQGICSYVWCIVDQAFYLTSHIPGAE